MFSTEIFHSTDVDWPSVFGQQGVHIEFVGGERGHEGGDLLQSPLLSGTEQHSQPVCYGERQAFLRKPLDHSWSLFFINQDQPFQMREVGGDTIWYSLQ